ncbi:unnamed protein product [Thlaspi arvense]|uniref:Eukaryotic translation initiation factor 3 subunit G n=1 Tax=Thlaspi arvense TaxID=13288 RepID=A0AAU9T2T4_THLAR|nr:unnamed protein product [Thlaspi arvense]
MEKTNKVLWEEVEDDDENLDFLLPAKQVIGPDENGNKTVIEYKFNDEGKTVKVTTRTRVHKGWAGDKPITVRRRTWAKFGDAVKDDASSVGYTTVSKECVFLERPQDLSGTKPEETKAHSDLGKPGSVLMICRNCGKRGEHWTARCPMSNHSSTDQVEASTSAVTNNSSSYVPPNMRGVSIAVSDTRRRRNDENSLRVTNLSEDTREPDLMDLFGTFGAVSRAYVVFDQNTGVSRGFGFVNFMSREDAQRAINNLDGYGYDNLILRVEWATPRSN